MNHISESLNTPVRYETDVLVVGGGFAGIAAALAAARQGKKVTLVERTYTLGGLGTLGLVTIYLPLCDGFGRQVSFGIAEELARLSVSRYPSATRGYDNWIASDDKAGRTDKTNRFELDFNPHLFAMLAEKTLIDAGVKILYGTYAVAAEKKDGKITAVIVENKSGRLGIAVRSVVDSTGDADLAVLSGTPTVRYGKGNVLAAWYYEAGKTEGYTLHMLGFCDVPTKDLAPGEEVPKLVNRRFEGLDAEELSEMTILSHRSILADFDKMHVKKPDSELATIAGIPQVRMTRRVDGAYTLDEKEVHTYFEDSVGMVSDWRHRGPVFEIPFRTLYSEKTKNLIFAGRCTSVTDDMWDIMRVIPCCAVTGEAAGVAAAMTDDFTTLNVGELQENLRKGGVVIHEKDLEN